MNVRLPWMLLGLMALAGPWNAPLSLAQEQFTTQSGGRGVVNARTNARLSKTELELEAAKAELAKIKPHAKEEILTCIEEGNKLRWDGKAWTCSEEIDPTVQAWAKTALPTCTDGRMLSVVGGSFGCSTASFVTVENDPTVQAFAKEALPVCGPGQVLSAGSDGRLTCSNDEQGLTRELDPNVHDFARTTTGLPACSGSEVLTMTGGRLSCKPDQLGLTVESDPRVQDFARNDITGYALTACATGELVRSVTQTGKVVLKCENASASLAETFYLRDLIDVDTAGQTVSDTLVFDGTEWQPQAQLGSSGNPLFLSQLGDVTIATALADQVVRFDGSRWVNSDDKLGTLTDTKWCRVVGSEIVCNIDAPPNCSATQLLSWDFGNNSWVCENVASKVGGALSLNDLNDVTVTSVVNGQVLRWGGTGWVNSMLERVLMDDTQVLVSDTGANGTITLATDGQSRMLVDQDGRVGIGVQPSAPYYLDVSGTTRLAGGLVTADMLAANAAFTGNVTVYGNLNVSGSQSLDGVMFANGGIQMPGTLTGGAVSSTYLSTTVADIRTLRVTNDATIGGALNLNDLTAVSATLGRLVVNTDGLVNGNLRVAGNLQVSGSQTIDGVVFANGGITMSGGLLADRVSASDVSASVADVVTLRAENISGSIGSLSQVSVMNNVTVGGVVTAGSASVGTLAAGGLTATSATVSGDLRVGGNFYVSGSQSIDGVVFASGGITMSGGLLADRVSVSDVSASVADVVLLRTTNASVGAAGIGQLNVTNTSASVADVSGNLRVSGTTRVQDLVVNGNLQVSGSQTIDGVLFANGGITMSGALTTPNISATNISGSVADIVTLRATTVSVGAAGISALTATSATVTGDLRVGGNFYVSGSQTIDGVSFANGGVSATGTVTATAFAGSGAGLTDVTAASMNWFGLTNVPTQVQAVSNGTPITLGGLTLTGTLSSTGVISAATVTATTLNASAASLSTLSAGSASVGAAGVGALTATSATVTGDLRVGGNFYVSGSQTIDGVSFANGGVSATGTVTATAFAGSGAGLTNLPASGIVAAGSTGSVQFKGDSGEISGTGAFTYSAAAQVLAMPGMVSVTNVKLATTGAEVCDTAGLGTMRFNSVSGRLQICRP